MLDAPKVMAAAVSDAHTGISIRFIRSFDPEQCRVPSAPDIEVLRRLYLEAFLKTAPDYDPATHDDVIRRTVWGADV